MPTNYGDCVKFMELVGNVKVSRGKFISSFRVFHPTMEKEEKHFHGRHGASHSFINGTCDNMSESRSFEPHISADFGKTLRLALVS